MSTNQAGDEAIRILDDAQFETLRDAIRAARRKQHPNSKTRMQSNAEKIAEAEYQAAEEGLEIGANIWRMRREGYTKGEIRKELGISLTVIDSCLREYELRMGMEAGRAMEHYRMLDDERIESMMKYWLPIACYGRIRIEHVRDGEVYSENDFDRPLKAGFFVLQAMNMRLKIMQASRPEGSKESGTNVLVWLQNCLPGVQKVMQSLEAPREILVMETEAEKDAL